MKNVIKQKYLIEP